MEHHPIMHIYRITVVLAGGARTRYTALFATTVEAVMQTLADWPDARRVSAICITQEGTQC